VPAARKRALNVMNHFCKKVIRASVRLPSKANALVASLLLAFVRVYQKTLSPVLPVIFGPACGCRFYPTCSHYAAEALQVHGALRGTWLALLRLLKCTPLHPGGIDPVPPARKLSCSRVTPHSLNDTVVRSAVTTLCQ